MKLKTLETPGKEGIWNVFGEGWNITIRKCRLEYP
jgi:hypothetical protein